MQGLDRSTLVVLVVAVLVGLAGAIFIGQGLGIITGGSAMVGDRTWAIIGAVMVLGALWVGRRTWLRRAP
jgi:hypothetical protein